LSDLRSRIASELLWAPSVVLPIVAGASAWLISWAGGGLTALNVAGLVGVLVGFGWFATRAIFYSDDIAAMVVREQEAKAIQAEESKLDDLLYRLRADRDFRTKDYLTLLRTCRSEFEEFAKRPGIAIQSHEIVKQVRQLFWSATEQLEQSLKMHDLAERLAGDQRKKVLEQREQILAEINVSIEHMQSAVKHYQELMNKEQNSDLSSLRDELDASLRVARRTEERMRELEGSTNYDAYLKE
jgi:paraquat-inducible protein B